MKKDNTSLQLLFIGSIGLSFMLIALPLLVPIYRSTEISYSVLAGIIIYSILACSLQAAIMGRSARKEIFIISLVGYGISFLTLVIWAFFGKAIVGGNYFPLIIVHECLSCLGLLSSALAWIILSHDKKINPSHPPIAEI